MFPKTNTVYIILTGRRRIQRLKRYTLTTNQLATCVLHSEQCLYLVVIRHSRLPAGNECLLVLSDFYFIFIFLFFRHQGFRMITFDRGPLQNFNRSHVMVIGRSVSFSDPARPSGGGVGRPKHPKIPPSVKNSTSAPNTPAPPPPRPRPVLRTLTPLVQ